jgi:hypothetical protein
MPYTVRKVDGGWKVFKKGTSKSYSKKPFKTKTAARKQQAALYVHANEELERLLDVVYEDHVSETTCD